MYCFVNLKKNYLFVFLQKYVRPIKAVTSIAGHGEYCCVARLDDDRQSKQVHVLSDGSCILLVTCNC